MIMVGIFCLDLIRGIREMNRKYTWIENMEVWIRSFRTFFIIHCLYWFSLGFMLLLYEINNIIGTDIWEDKWIGGLNVGDGFNIIAMIFWSMVVMYAILKMFEKDSRIQEIRLKYERKEKIKVGK